MRVESVVRGGEKKKGENKLVRSWNEKTNTQIESEAFGMDLKEGEREKEWTEDARVIDTKKLRIIAGHFLLPSCSLVRSAGRISTAKGLKGQGEK